MKALEPQVNEEDKELMEKLLSAGHIEHKYAVRLQTLLLRAKNEQPQGKPCGIDNTFRCMFGVTYLSKWKLNARRLQY